MTHRIVEVQVGYLGGALDHPALFRPRLHESVVDVMADAVIGTDLEYRVTLWNPAAERLYGYSAEEAIGRPACELTTYENDASRRQLEAALHREGVAHVEFRARTKSGVWRDVELIASAVRDEAGDSVGYLGIHRDISARRRADLERRRLSAVIEASPDFIGVCDLDGRPLYLNEAGQRLVGLRGMEEVQAHHIADFFAPEERAAVRDRLPRLLAHGREARELDFLNLRTGERVPVSWNAFRIDDPDTGERLALATITRDLRERQRQTRRQAAVAELGGRASRDTDAAALMEEAVAVVSRTLEVEFVAVAEVVDGGSQMLLRAGMGWGSGEVRARVAAPSHEVFVGHAVRAGAPIVSDDLRLEDRRRPSELLLSYGVTSAAVVPIMGQRSPFGAVAVFSRERRRFDADEVNFLRAIANVLHGAVERSALAQRLLQVRDAERRRLARALHDETLQELGLVIARAANPALGTGGVDHELVARLTRIGEQVRAAVHDLRLEDSSHPSFPTLISELTDLHRPRLPDVDCVIAPDVPERPPRDISVNVLRVLGEALTNAERHASASRVQVHVHLDGAALVATVRDDGTGVTVARPPSVSGGHGISGMRERAELLGGELNVDGAHGGGTLVELRVPLPQRHGPADRVRVLLVDDHTAVREALALAFAQDDEFVIAGEAGSLAEARGLLDGVDVVVVDLELPDGDGADLIEDLHERDSRIQTLVLSAHADRATVAHAVQKGATAVLSKTTHLHQIVSAVRRVRDGETLMPLDEVVDLLRFASRLRERELDERRLIESLTPREREVLQLLAEGFDSAAIARRLHISPRTQRNHVGNILAKLEVHSQLQAVVFALRHGVVRVPGEPAEV